MYVRFYFVLPRFLLATPLPIIIAIWCDYCICVTKVVVNLFLLKTRYIYNRTTYTRLALASKTNTQTIDASHVFIGTLSPLRIQLLSTNLHWKSSRDWSGDCRRLILDYLLTWLSPRHIFSINNVICVCMCIGILYTTRIHLAYVNISCCKKP